MIIVLGGMALALSAAPTDWWWMAPVGFALFYRRNEGRRRRRAFSSTFIASFAAFLITLSWARQFSVPGYVLLAAVEALFSAVPLALIPRAKGPWRAIAFPAALTTGEWLRIHIPFGGLPMGGPTTGLAGSPLAPAAALVGELGLFCLLTVLGVALVELLRLYDNHRWAALATLAAVVGVSIGGAQVATTGVGTMTPALLQGGGTQGLERSAQDPDGVIRRHLATMATVPAEADVILWPEDTVQVTQPIDQTREGALLAAAARTKQASVVGGIVTVQGDRFRNTAAVWDPSGTLTSEYDKVHRVPFGEYIPFRGVLERFVDLSQVPDDAIAGTGPAYVTLTNRAGESYRAGVAISFEELFSRRVREGVRRGGEVVLIPTNASSYFSTKVSAIQENAARLRALETGRAVLQAAPTGVSAIVSPEGQVVQRSSIGPPAVLTATIERRHGLTPYARFGDAPLLVVVTLIIGGSAVVGGRRVWLRRRPGYPGP